MTQFTPEQEAILNANSAAIEDSAEAKKSAEDLRLNLAIAAAEAAAYPMALLTQLAEFDPRSSLGNQTLNSLRSFKVWQKEFEKELEIAKAKAEQASQATDNGQLEDEPTE